MSILYTSFITFTFAIAISSYKYLPFAYQFRFWSLLVNYLFILPPPPKQTPFQICIRKTYCSPLECDLFGLHKTNSSYFVELDLARTETVLRAFHGYFKTKKPFVPLAEITCHFLKEIKPLQKYQVISRVIAVGEKWCYVLSFFVTDDKNGISLQLNGVNYRVCAISIGKLVFKDGKKTVNVNQILPSEYQSLGLDNEKLIKNSIDDPIKLINLFTSVSL